MENETVVLEQPVSNYVCEECKAVMPEWDWPLLCQGCRDSHRAIAKTTEIDPSGSAPCKIEYSHCGIGSSGHYSVGSRGTTLAHIGTWNKTTEQQCIDAAMVANIELLWDFVLDAARKGDVWAAWTVSGIVQTANKLINEDDDDDAS